MAITGFSSMRIASYWWYLPLRSLTAAVCSSVPGSRSSALPRTITKARRFQSSAYRSAMSATSGFSRMFLTRLSRVTGTSFGFSSRAMKIEARVRAKHTGTACGLPIPSEVARRATLWRTRKAA